jgi:SAM-dependent methyltransferase
MNNLDFDLQFDHITSICVYEHIPVYDRVEINKSIKKLLMPGGRFSITFDFRNPSRLAMINTPGDVYEQFVRPSGLYLRENQNFVDTGICYLLHPVFHPNTSSIFKLKSVLHGNFMPWEIFKLKSSNDYTFGALFQEKH